MNTDKITQFDVLLAKSQEYSKKGLSQEALRTLQAALEICSDDGFPNTNQSRQQILFEIGCIKRRFGQYAESVDMLNRALSANEHASPVARAMILGELGVVYRSSNEFAKAQKTFNDQYKLAADTATNAEAEMCRAVGNEGMSAYNLYQQQSPPDHELLQTATRKLEERIERAQKLHERLLREDPGSRYVHRSMLWRTIGMDRLTLCYIAYGKPMEAVELAVESQRSQTFDDPTVKGASRFFYGHALWKNGQHEEAIKQWNVPSGTCSPAIAFCKEVSAEYVQYLRLLAEAEVDFNSYDEHGFSALDYAVFSENEDASEAVRIIVDAFRTALRKEYQQKAPKLPDDDATQRIEEEVQLRLQQAKIRRSYRGILQEYIRPELRTQRPDSLPNVRRICTDLFAKDESIRSVFDKFYFVAYKDFKSFGKLPRSGQPWSASNKQLARELSSSKIANSKESDLFIIFISYRWLGNSSDPRLPGPDNVDDDQYHRIVTTVEAFLEEHSNLDHNNVGLWLDCACINQGQPQQRERGINSLPLAVIQCDAMISFVDEQYYSRAWCVVEVMLFHELIQSYHLHQWYEHILESPATDRRRGKLRRGVMNSELNIAELHLTEEKLDRPKVDFLMRQSKLLGRDDA